MEAPPSDYGPWLQRYFPAYVTAELAEHHHEFWRWAWGVGGDEHRDDRGTSNDGGSRVDSVLRQSSTAQDTPYAETGINGHKGYSANVDEEEIVVSEKVESTRPYVAIWPRGGGKSTSAELAVTALGARGRRRYCLYVSGTQDQADKHVASIERHAAAPEYERDYPAAAARSVNKYGHSRGWRRNRLHMANGFVVDALGLDTAARGIKVDHQRPDLIVFDDIDQSSDTALTTAGKLDAITRAILPAGSNDVAILAIQNLVHPDGVFARLANPEPPFLRHRTLSGPVRAVRDALFDGQSLTGGTPTWPEGQSLETCQRQIDEWGLDAWLAEAQHEVGLQARVGLVLGEDPDDGVLILDPRENVCDAPQKWVECLWRVVSIDPGGGDPGAMVAMGIGQRALPIRFLREGDGTEIRPEHIYNVRRYLNGASLNDIHRQLQEWDAAGRIDAVFVGETGGDTLVRSLVSLGWPAEKANMHRSQIKYLAQRFKDRILTVSPKCWPDVEREAKSYWWKVQRPGQAQPVDPYATETGTGHHADVIDAVRYAVASVKDRLPGRRVQMVGQVGRGLKLGQVGRRIA